MNSQEKKKGSYFPLWRIKGGSPFLPVEGGDRLQRFIFHPLRKGEQLYSGDASYQVLFLQQGSGMIRTENGKDICLEEGQCGMVNLIHISFYALEDSFVILWNPEAGLYPSDRSFLRSLHPEVIASSYRFRPFSIQPAIADFLRLLSDYYRDGKMETELLYELKQQELFLLLRHYYSREELVQLFYPIVYRMDEFREKILDALKEAQSSGELMRLVGMKRTSFERKFRRNFGTSVHQWILRQKAVEVRKSLEDLTLSVDEVRKQHGFNSATHFVRFCRSQLGATPTELRKKDSESVPKGRMKKNKVK